MTRVKPLAQSSSWTMPCSSSWQERHIDLTVDLYAPDAALLQIDDQRMLGRVDIRNFQT
jgi:hypothetical protein